MAYVNLQDLAFEAFSHIDKKEFEQAETKLSYLLNLKPQEPTLYYFLGCLYLERKQYALSCMAYEKALQYRPDFDECLCNMAASYRQMGDIETCIKCFTKALDIARSPNYLEKCGNDTEKATKNLADYLANLGSCYVAKGTPDKAIELLEEAIKIYPTRPNSMWNAGLAYLEKGDYEKGFKGYTYNLLQEDAKTRNFHGEGNKTKVWDGTKGETVVVYGEQGIGDEIMFSSMLDEVNRDTKVIFECHPRLIDLYRASFPHIEIYGTRKSKEIAWLPKHKIDAQIPLSQLGQFYRKSKDDFPGTPYLKANQRLVGKMHDKLQLLGDGPKIGISWKGGINITNKGVRSIPLELLKPLFHFDVDFISLQYHNNAQHEVDTFNESQGLDLIHHWQKEIDDYDLTAALLMNLDMVISVPQSVVHLAGALGVETIQMCPKQGLWQMGPYGEDAPWYKCVRNIWQVEDGAWESVVARVFMELEQKGYGKC